MSYQEALDRIAAARPGQEKNNVLWDVMKDETIRDQLRIAVDPNEQIERKPSQLKGVGVIVLNKAHAGLAKHLHIASEVAVLSESDPKLWEMLVPVENWVMMPCPPSTRALLYPDGTVRGMRGFIVKLDSGYERIIEGALTLPGVRTALDYYDRIGKGDVTGAKFIAYDVVSETEPFTTRRDYIENVMDCLPVNPIASASSMFAEWRKKGYNGAIFRNLNSPYVIGIDRGLIICQFGQVIKKAIARRDTRKKSCLDAGSEIA